VTATRWFPETRVAAIERAGAASGLVAGVTPVIAEPIAVQDPRSRQTESRVTLFGTDPARQRAFGDLRTADGRLVTLGALLPGEVYLNAKAGEKLDARPGDTLRLLVGTSLQTARVRAIVRYDGGGTADAGLVVPLAVAQQLLARPGLVEAVYIVNRHGVRDTDAVIRDLTPTLAPLGLEADNTRQDALRLADDQGAAFMSMFTTFGSFSIAAGVLLIFLIFVMLAAERRGELGIARAVGTQRHHLVQLFVFEGLAYDLLAAVCGAVLGMVVAYGMVLVMAGAISTSGDITIRYSVRPASMLIAYAVGVLLTFAVVLFSAWRVSRMNIVTAIRDLPDPPRAGRGRRRLVPAVLVLLLGALLAVQGVGAKDAITLGFGVLLLVLGIVPLLRLAGAPDRVVYTGAGLGLVVWFVLPIERWFFGELKTNFSMFILAGLAIVVGASWAVMYNADLLLAAVKLALGRSRRLGPVAGMSMAYALRSRFRTGITLAMFTLVVFTLVCGAVITGSFVNGLNDVRTFGGGFDVRATTSPASPVLHMRAAVASAPDLAARDFRVVSSESVLPIKARQAGTPRGFESYLVYGADRAFLGDTTYAMSATARGYASSRAVWQALATHRNLAVVDGAVVPRRANYNFAAPSKFALSGFYLEDRTFDPIPIDVRDPQTGRQTRLTVIGVLSDTAPLLMAGIWTSQATLAPAFPGRVPPTVHLFALRPGADPEATAKRLESSFLANGLQADSLHKLLADAISSSVTFDRLIEGFMGLGLIVGVAALGVISARSVVERRQHIGVLRAIGVRRRAVQASFLLEASFIAVTSIVVGTALGLAVAYNVIADQRRQPSWEGLGFDVPWLTLTVIFLTVYGVAMATTLAPARRAARVYPAEALRYQ
jgi:putative ABC transport system permease protein